jgi:glycosyltransferase involved in cell wall biosynthesis
MKILQINNCHYNRGGADIVYLNTGELLESHGNDVSYFSIRNDLNEKTKFQKYFVRGVDFLNISLFKKILYFFRFFYSIESKRNLNMLIEDCKPQIAHVHLYKGGLTPSILGVLKKNKIPVLVTLHDYGFLDPHNLLLDGNLNISEKCITSSSFNCVKDKSNRDSYLLSLVSTLEYIYHSKLFPFDKYFNTIVAVSKFSQDLHLKSDKFNWSIDHLYNFSPLLNSHEETIKQGSNYLLYFGRLSKEKGIKTLIDAVEKLDIKIDLKIVGTGVLEIELKKYIQDNNLTNIKLLGFKKGEELHELIRESKFVIVPSQWYENNPMTIIESYCFGVPVIGSRIGGIPEIIDEGKTGFTYEMGNVDDLVVALTKGINLSEEEYIKFKNNAKDFAEENFSPNSHYKELMKLYNKTIEKTRFNDGQK